MKQHQKELDKFFKENKWPYWPPLVILARLFEECGELARVVNHLYGKKPKKKTESEQDLEEEVGDILFTMICMANSLNISLDSAIRKSLSKAMKRDKNRFNDQKKIELERK